MEQLITMTKQELDDMIYYAALRASSRACTNLFNGLIPFIDRLSDDNGIMIEALDYLKLLSNEAEKPIGNNWGSHNNPEVVSIMDNLSDEKKQEIKEMFNTKNNIKGRV